MLHKLPSAALAVHVVRSYGYTVRTSRAVLQDQMRETREELRNAREAFQRPGLEIEGLFRFGSAAADTNRDRVTRKGFWGPIPFLVETTAHQCIGEPTVQWGTTWERKAVISSGGCCCSFLLFEWRAFLDGQPDSVMV